MLLLLLFYGKITKFINTINWSLLMKGVAKISIRKKEEKHFE